ncbi:hypothetical protein CEXT_409301 [Caerostris extrusa]|uniref:Uncharacterized protein n=1 Tax=Caerostris extrusa TaxID=172846 RepID=A0AAV4P1X2_CAEEX|nr:hypothetical protein CEXT_409301 [Caerostris extrusa]
MLFTALIQSRSDSSKNDQQHHQWKHLLFIIAETLTGQQYRRITDSTRSRCGMSLVTKEKPKGKEISGWKSSSHTKFEVGMKLRPIFLDLLRDNCESKFSI